MAICEFAHKTKQYRKRFLLLGLCLCFLAGQFGCVPHKPSFSQYDSITFAANLKADPLSPCGKKAAYYQSRIYYLSSELGAQGIYSMDSAGDDVKLEIPVEDIRAIQLLDDGIYYSGFAGVQQNADGPYRQFRLFSRNFGDSESKDFLTSAEYKDVPRDENVWDFYVSGDSLIVLRFINVDGYDGSSSISAVTFLNKKALQMNDFQVISNIHVNYTAPLEKPEITFVHYNNLYYELGIFDTVKYGDFERFTDWSSISVYDSAKHLVALPLDRMFSTAGAWASSNILHWICRVDDGDAIFATKQGLEAYNASTNTLSQIVSFPHPECMYHQIDEGDMILVFTQQLRKSGWGEFFATELFKFNRALGESLYRVNPDVGDKTLLLKIGRNQAFLYADRNIAATASGKTISIYDISTNTPKLQKTIQLTHKIVDRANKVDTAGGWLFLYRFNEETQRDELIEKVFIG